jgi:hypothetical protein
MSRWIPSKIVNQQVKFQAAVVIAFNRTACATAESTTSSLSGCLVRHVAADASKTREVNAGATAGEGKSAPITGSTRGSRSSQDAAVKANASCVHRSGNHSL